MTERYVVPYAGQGTIFTSEDLDAVASLLHSGAHLSGGTQRAAFESEFAEAIGCAHAVTTTSCTMALELVTQILGLGGGDTVIASPLTYQATVASLLTRGVTVRFGDIDPDTLALTPSSLARLADKDTRAVYVTHYGGRMADMAGITEIARDRGLVVVEDCAHALGSSWEGRSAGTIGDFGCWSFHSLKNISTLGQGGMVTTRHADAAARLRRISTIQPDIEYVPLRSPMSFGPHRVPGTDEPERHAGNAYTHACATVHHGGTNATMSEPAAAVGRTQLCKLTGLVERRRAIARRLDELLSRIPGVRVPAVPSGYSHSYHLYTFFVDPSAGVDRDRLIVDLQRAGVEIVLRYFPLHLLPEWRARGGTYGDCPVTERLWFEELVNLPIYPSLTDGQVDFMADAVEGAIARQLGSPQRPGPVERQAV